MPHAIDLNATPAHLRKARRKKWVLGLRGVLKKLGDEVKDVERWVQRNYDALDLKDGPNRNPSTFHVAHACLHDLSGCPVKAVVDAISSLVAKVFPPLKRVAEYLLCLGIVLLAWRNIEDADELAIDAVVDTLDDMPELAAVPDLDPVAA